MLLIFPPKYATPKSLKVSHWLGQGMPDLSNAFLREPTSEMSLETSNLPMTLDDNGWLMIKCNQNFWYIYICIYIYTVHMYNDIDNEDSQTQTPFRIYANYIPWYTLIFHFFPDRFPPDLVVCSLLLEMAPGFDGMHRGNLGLNIQCPMV